MCGETRRCFIKATEWSCRGDGSVDVDVDVDVVVVVVFFLFTVLVVVVVDDIMFSGPPTVRFLIPIFSFVFPLFPLFNSFSVVFLASDTLCTNCKCVDSRVSHAFSFSFSFRSYFLFLTSYFSTLH